MDIIDGIFRFMVIDEDALIPFGFTAEGGAFCLHTPIADGQMDMRVEVCNGKIKADVFDVETGDVYSLHTVDGAAGEFVGKVRSDFESVLTTIAERCCHKEIFKMAQSKEVISFIKRTYGDELEFLWDDLPDAAIWRRKDNRKWYGILMTVKACKVGLEGERLVEVIDLRAAPEEIERIADGKNILRGYHMNKKTWFTVRMDGSVATDEIERRIMDSFEIAGVRK